MLDTDVARPALALAVYTLVRRQPFLLFSFLSLLHDCFFIITLLFPTKRITLFGYQRGYIMFPGYCCVGLGLYLLLHKHVCVCIAHEMGRDGWSD
ncbi:hypothetical protein BDY21DRAFT_355991 [Lineolata rhizophorae]|uniref:Uncharacterized protein n=1 Tax=Lineolata rhizophorae TaxID=578093 RepID=A0A6A6NQA0_9PEZI|nr:hypothetical protein BDY21DRAFT_355991 [Lineolata rhizophorae]